MAASYMVALAALALVPATATMTIDFKDNASFTIALGDGRNILLESSPLRAFMHGAWHYNLTRNSTARMSGTDELGAFRCVNVSWTVADTVPLHTSLVTYPAKPDVAVFVVDLPRGAQDTNASNPTLPSGQHAHALDAGAYPPSVAFPAFQSDAGLLPQLGYLSWAGVMVGSTSGTDAPRSLQGMKGNGPVVLFDGNFSHTLVVSPMDNFKSAVHSRALVGVPGRGLLQMQNAARHDHALCAGVASQCFGANEGSYDAVRVEGVMPSDAQIAAAAAALGAPATAASITQPLHLYYSRERQDNRVTNATTPPAGEGYCATAADCFDDGVVFSVPIAGTVPLTLWYSTARKDSLTVGTAAGAAFARANGYALVGSGTVGYVYPAPDPGAPIVDAWETGVSSEIERLPRGFRHRTLLVAGEGGITATMDAWGRTLRTAYETDRSAVEADKVPNYLSYFTDNGAYYYGDAWHEAGGGGDPCNETSMIAVADGLEAQGLLDATQTWQLDDWWYPGPS